MIRRRISFSPLFVGDASSTLHEHGADWRDCLFQSPLRRGCFFNRMLEFDSDRVVAFQSPLRRGCFFNVNPIRVQPFGCVFQSPLRRGCFFNRSTLRLFSGGYKPPRQENFANPKSAQKPGRFAKFRDGNGCKPSALSFHGKTAASRQPSAVSTILGNFPLPSLYWPVTTWQRSDSKRPTKLQVTGYSIRRCRWRCCLLPPSPFPSPLHRGWFFNVFCWLRVQ